MMVLNSRCENFDISHRFAKNDKLAADSSSYSQQLPASNNNNSSSSNNNNNNISVAAIPNAYVINGQAKTATSEISFSTPDYDEDYSVASNLHDSKNTNRFDVHQMITQEDPSLRRALGCNGCGLQIFDRVYYFLRDDNTVWHADCLRCNVCKQCLQHNATCHVRNSLLYCKPDYAKHFSIRCARCTRQIQPTDWVRRAKNMVYHLACFACDSCKRQLSTGEEFAIVDSKVLCKTHYAEMIDGASSEDGKSRGKPKTKRIRTTFTEEQIQILQANFAIDSNPDSQDLERLAQLTGLSKRVTQVWFQNSRAREKKRQKVAQILAKQQQDSTGSLEVQTALLLANNEQSSGSNASQLLFTPDSSSSISSDSSD